MPGGAEAEQGWAFTASLPPLTEQMMAPDLTASPARLNPSARPSVRPSARPADNQVLLLAPFLAQPPLCLSECCGGRSPPSLPQLTREWPNRRVDSSSQYHDLSLE